MWAHFWSRCPPVAHWCVSAVGACGEQMFHACVRACVCVPACVCVVHACQKWDTVLGRKVGASSAQGWRKVLLGRVRGESRSASNHIEQGVARSPTNQYDTGRNPSSPARDWSISPFRAFPRKLFPEKNLPNPGSGSLEAVVFVVCRDSVLAIFPRSHPPNPKLRVDRLGNLQETPIFERS